MATRKSSKPTKPTKPAKPASQMHPSTVAKDAREAAKSRAAQPKTPVAPAPAAIPQPRSTPTLVTVRSETGRTSTAAHANAPRNDRVVQANRAETRDKVKSVEKCEKAEIARRVKADVLAHKPVSAARLDACTAADLHAICREYGRGKGSRFTGHSTLKKDELVGYIATGDKPTVTKSDKAPGVGTMQHNLALLRSRNGGKGYTAKDTAACKAMFGVTISTLKAEQLRQLVAKLGL